MVKRSLLSDTRLAILESGFGLGGWIPRAISATALPPQIPAADRDRYWMSKALLEAMEAVGRSSPNPSVGAVLVQGDKVLGRASTQVYGSFHAEAMALLSAKSAGFDVKTAECYVTLEPCGGLGGKQAPCADALIASGIGRVIFAAEDPHQKAGGLGTRKLEDASISIARALTNEANAWHFPFLAYQQKQKPIVIGKWAQTLDGHLADDHDKSQWISGPRSRAYTHWLRQKYDAIMVGINTVLHDQPRLTVRDSALPRARDPQKIIFDPKARLATASSEVLNNLFEATSSGGPLVYWCIEAGMMALPASLEVYRDRLVLVPTIRESNWDELFQSLSNVHQKRYGFELQSILFEGGSQLLTLLMRADQLDACHIFVRAGVLGGTRNRIGRLERGENPTRDLMERDDYRLLATAHIDDDVLIETVSRKYDFWK